MSKARRQSNEELEQRFEYIETTVLSGSYTPTLANITGTSALSVDKAWSYMRVGNVITVSGKVFVQGSAGADVSFSATLPVLPTNNFTNNDGSLGGAGLINQGTSSNNPVGIYGYGSSKLARFRWFNSAALTTELYFSFTYRLDN